MIRRCANCGCEDVELVEYGPELPDLIYAHDGTVWGHRPSGGQVWWYGSSKLVTWSQLLRMARGAEPLTQFDRDHCDFPWGPWVGASYGDDHAAILEQLGVPA